ncbi:thiamine phosphate synthase [Alicyclobacillus fodiniaquatilis]|uniref:Thiamine-phosphate synthase n=1 Tax=Alicyclobacillus fodiniaquatilis TaxID=1661150 RepID=A0ABW4JEM5_9BACL
MNTVLHVISDRNRRRLPLVDALVEAAKGGADVIQIREKKAPASETYTQVKQLQQHLATNGLAARVYVNDRTDIAIATDMDGVHLAAKSLPIETVKALRGRANWHGRIGCSVHHIDEAVQAEKDGADYVTFGHVFASESHPDIPPRGLYALRRIVEALSIPVIAIGGIDHTNVGAVLDTGCSGIAVIGAILDTTDPRGAAEELKAAMARADAHPKVPF